MKARGAKYAVVVEVHHSSLLRFQAPVVQTMDSAVHRINHYPADNSIGFASV